MNVRELIQNLKEQDPEAEVHLVYDYGDHWHTLVAPRVATVREGFVVDSAYYRMARVISADYNDDKAQVVVLLMG